MFVLCNVQITAFAGLIPKRSVWNGVIYSVKSSPDHAGLSQRQPDTRHHNSFRDITMLGLCAYTARTALKLLLLLLLLMWLRAKSVVCVSSCIEIKPCLISAELSAMIWQHHCSIVSNCMSEGGPVNLYLIILCSSSKPEVVLRSGFWWRKQLLLQLL